MSAVAFEWKDIADHLWEFYQANPESFMEPPDGGVNEGQFYNWVRIAVEEYDQNHVWQRSVKPDDPVEEWLQFPEMERATRMRARKLIAETGIGPDNPGTEIANHLWEFYQESPSSWPKDERGSPPKRVFYAWVELEALSSW